jgi:hypothetical protein
MRRKTFRLKKPIHGRFAGQVDFFIRQSRHYLFRRQITELLRIERVEHLCPFFLSEPVRRRCLGTLASVIPASRWLFPTAVRVGANPDDLARFKEPSPALHSFLDAF